MVASAPLAVRNQLLGYQHIHAHHPVPSHHRRFTTFPRAFLQVGASMVVHWCLRSTESSATVCQSLCAPRALRRLINTRRAGHSIARGGLSKVINQGPIIVRSSPKCYRATSLPWLRNARRTVHGIAQAIVCRWLYITSKGSGVIPSDIYAQPVCRGLEMPAGQDMVSRMVACRWLYTTLNGPGSCPVLPCLHATTALSRWSQKTAQTPSVLSRVPAVLAILLQAETH